MILSISIITICLCHDFYGDHFYQGLFAKEPNRIQGNTTGTLGGMNLLLKDGPSHLIFSLRRFPIASMIQDITSDFMLHSSL
mmetsp:Transcript_37574/g.108501  ORF Transcript_37574/g.108501 Transcript_37574/m.108501 type:complete len:82 (-) Transcript_37574:20-265(-)